MKTILNNNLELNEVGLELNNKIKKYLKPLFTQYVMSGYNPIELEYLLSNLIKSLNKDNINYITEYYNNKKYNTDHLDIINSETSEIKKASFHSYGKSGYRYWIYEEGWEPNFPYGIREFEGNKLWYLLIDIGEGVDSESL